MTLTRIDLVERIFILEAGLDARVIEYIKHLVYLNNRIRTDPVRKRILFNAKDSTDEQLMFVIQDVETGQLERALTHGGAAYNTGLAPLIRMKPPVSATGLSRPVISARQALLDFGAPRGATADSGCTSRTKRW